MYVLRSLRMHGLVLPTDLLSHSTDLLCKREAEQWRRFGWNMMGCSLGAERDTVGFEKQYMDFQVWKAKRFLLLVTGSITVSITNIKVMACLLC